MVAERKKIIDDILCGYSVRLRESYFKNNFVKIYEEIELFNKELDITFVQKIWHWVNDINYYIKCDCGNKVSFNKNWKNGYKKHCSSKCTQSDITTKEKRKQTVLKKYGVDNIAKNKAIRDKTIETNIRKYGHISSFQNEDVRNKWIETIRNNYGVDHYFKTDEFKIKAKKYYLQKYGVEHQLQSEEIIKKIKKTCLKKYGVETYLNTEHARSCIKKYNKSSYEIEIINWLKTFNIDVIESSNKIINPYSLDIYLPEYNLAIEFNGLWWHNEFYKDKNYHLNKTILCFEKNIKLLHVWEDDWLNSKEIIKSMILYRINNVKEKIYARKCVIKPVNNEDTSNFLNKNHIQGYTRFSESIGLYYNDELVSLMSFGFRATNGKREYELIRFCNKINYYIIGSASKLFKYFIRTHLDINEIISYADISLFTGSIYKTLGFNFEKRSMINYWWVVNGIRKHRFNFNKSKLIKMGYDPLKTEVEIMHEIGNYRVFGCGQDKWIWNR